VNTNDDMKYRDLINTLKQLQEVKAPAGFETGLMRKINSGRFREEKSIWQKAFLPSRLIPTAALAVTAILLIFVLNNTGVTQDNPLLTAPRERKDVTLSVKTDKLSRQEKPAAGDEAASSKEISGIQKDKGVQNNLAERPVQKTEGISLSPKANITAGTVEDDRFITADFTSGRIADYPVNKAGLNFRQVNLSNEQKLELNKLKEKLETMFRDKGKQ
jgi:hypothetical protein